MIRWPHLVVALAGCAGGLAACGDSPADADRDAGADGAVRDAAFADRTLPGADGAACGVGVPCEQARGCSEFLCQASLTSDLGSVSDPIAGYSAERIPNGAPLFAAGYCTSAPINQGTSAPGCEPTEPDSCPPCARCVTLFQSEDIPRRSCLRQCTPTMTDNPCPAQYACQLGLEVCLDACVSDDTCRVARRDTDDDGDIEPPAAGTGSCDRLVYDSTRGHRCDQTVGRCRHDGAPGSEAGDSCTWDGDCEADGRCLYGPRWEDQGSGTPRRGFCTKVGCDLPENGCAGGATCQRRGVGEPWCLPPCRVGAQLGSPSDPAYLFQFHGECRPGYACVWDGMTAGSVAKNGGCLPGTYNPVRAENVGDACARDTDCYSPLGFGRCGKSVLGDREDACYVTDCGAPLPAGVGPLCGEGATCIQFAGSGATICRARCSTALACGAGQACWNPSGTVGIASDYPVCLPFCYGASQAEADAGCRPTERCGGTYVPGADVGTCVTR